MVIRAECSAGSIGFAVTKRSSGRGRESTVKSDTNGEVHGRDGGLRRQEPSPSSRTEPVKYLVIALLLVAPALADWRWEYRSDARHAMAEARRARAEAWRDAAEARRQIRRDVYSAHREWRQEVRSAHREWREEMRQARQELARGMREAREEVRRSLREWR